VSAAVTAAHAEARAGAGSRILERLAPRYGAIPACYDVCAALQAGHVAAQQVEQHSLCNVVGVVAGADGVHLQQHGPAVQRLAPEHAAERAVVLVADFADDGVHAPAVQLLVGQHRQLQLVLPGVALHSFKRVVPVSGDAFVNAEQAQTQPVASFGVQLGDDVREDGGVFAARRGDADALAGAEEIAAHYSEVHLLQAVRAE
jgi:hypothetical protein